MLVKCRKINFVICLILTDTVAVTISWLPACPHRVSRRRRDVCIARSQHDVRYLRQRVSYWQCLRPTLSRWRDSIWKLKLYVWVDYSRRVVGE